jgi:hypothetical protein
MGGAPTVSALPEALSSSGDRAMIERYNAGSPNGRPKGR